MEISKSLLKNLVCPGCKRGLAYKKQHLSCKGCKKSYMIKSGIPILL